MPTRYAIMYRLTGDKSESPSDVPHEDIKVTFAEAQVLLERLCGDVKNDHAVKKQHGDCYLKQDPDDTKKTLLVNQVSEETVAKFWIAELEINDVEAWIEEQGF